MCDSEGGEDGKVQGGERTSALGRAEKSAGFRGVSIDVEYPYPRYELDRPDYRYESYTPRDLMAGTLRQEQTVMAETMNESSTPSERGHMISATTKSMPPLYTMHLASSLLELSS